MLTALLVALTCIIPGKEHNDGPVIVDMIELNHVYREKDGQYVYTQVVLWDSLEADDGKNFRVVGWHLIGNEEQIAYPYKSQGGMYRVTLTKYIDKYNKYVPVRVHSRIFRESWTMFDVDIVAGKFWLPYRSRPDLFNIPSEFREIPAPGNPFETED